MSVLLPILVYGMHVPCAPTGLVALREGHRSRSVRLQVACAARRHPARLMCLLMQSRGWACHRCNTAGAATLPVTLLAGGKTDNGQSVASSRNCQQGCWQQRRRLDPGRGTAACCSNVMQLCFDLYASGCSRLQALLWALEESASS